MSFVRRSRLDDTEVQGFVGELQRALVTTGKHRLILTQQTCPPLPPDLSPACPCCSWTVRQASVPLRRS